MDLKMLLHLVLLVLIYPAIPCLWLVTIQGCLRNCIDAGLEPSYARH